MHSAPIPVLAIATEAVASVGRRGKATANVVEMWYRPRRCAYENIGTTFFGKARMTYGK